jgi:hypothetical protein
MHLIIFITLLSSAVLAQEDPTTTTLTPIPSTTLSGQPYGGICNGFLAQCHTYGGTVACVFRQANETIGQDTCEQGSGVNLGRCQCQRNCRTGGLYEENGEFDVNKNKCVGLVGKTCSILAPDCTRNAKCSANVCACIDGFFPDEEGLRCISL